MTYGLLRIRCLSFSVPAVYLYLPSVALPSRLDSRRKRTAATGWGLAVVGGKKEDRQNCLRLHLAADACTSLLVLFLWLATASPLRTFCGMHARLPSATCDVAFWQNTAFLGFCGTIDLPKAFSPYTTASALLLQLCASACGWHIGSPRCCSACRWRPAGRLPKPQTTSTSSMSLCSLFMLLHMPALYLAFRLQISCSGRRKHTTRDIFCQRCASDSLASLLSLFSAGVLQAWLFSPSISRRARRLPTAIALCAGGARLFRHPFSCGAVRISSSSMAYLQTTSPHPRAPLVCCGWYRVASGVDERWAALRRNAVPPLLTRRHGERRARGLDALCRLVKGGCVVPEGGGRRFSVLCR